MYEVLNSPDNDSKPLASLGTKWCIAKFQGEWFRAYIEKVVEGDRLRVFFLDYGTLEEVDHSETRQVEDEEIWILPPLAIPFVIKGFH